MRVLAVDDDKYVTDLLDAALTELGFAVCISNNGDEAESLALYSSFDIILLDVKLKGKDGMTVCRELRQKGLKVPILMLTGTRIDLMDIVAGLDGGADDYMLKPFRIEELEARIRALLRRGRDAVNSRIEIGCLILDIALRKVWIDGLQLTLTLKEYAILECLGTHPEFQATRAELEQHTWNSFMDISSNTLDVHIMNLRKKLPSRCRIETIRGVGFKLVSD